MTLTATIEKQELSLERQFKEYEKCRLSPIYFLSKYVFIEDANNKRSVKWEPWTYLLSLIEDIENNDTIIVGKAKQSGGTWSVLGYIIHQAIFNHHFRALLYSAHEEHGSWELIDKCEFILGRLPSFLKREISHTNKGLIQFAHNGSRIEALASTSKQGVGYNASLVFRDELDYHEYAEANFLVVAATVQSGGKMIDMSTRNKDKTKEQSHFVSRYLKARDGALGKRAKAVFMSWNSRPVRKLGLTLQEWFDTEVRPQHTPYELEMLYPATEKEFLSEAQVTQFFDPFGVEYIRKNCYDPVDVDYDGVVKIWERPVPGRKYCAFLDPSDGYDPHAAGWMDVNTNRLVCISHGKVPLETCAEIFDKYNRLYSAFNEFELNGAGGQRMAQLLTDLKTPNRRVTGVSKDRKNKYGWSTGTQSKPLMLDTLKEAIANKRLSIHYSEVPNELSYMVKRPGEDPSVPTSKNNDLIMMLGGLLQIAREAQVGTVSQFSSGYCVGFGR